MNIQDFLQVQMLQMTSNVTNKDNIFYIILIQLFITCFTMIIKLISDYIPKITDYYEKKLHKSMNQTLVVTETNLKTKSIQKNNKHDLYKVYFTRIFEDNNYTDMNEIIDSILYYLSLLHNIPTLSFLTNSQYIVSLKDKYIQVTNDIYIKILDIQYDSKVRYSCVLSSLEFVLCSNTNTAIEIKEWVNKVHIDYKKEMENKLGNQVYYFDYYERPNIQSFDPRGDICIERSKKDKLLSAPKHLSFIMQEFHSNKSLSTLYGNSAKKLIKSVEFFVNNEEWYKKRGLPYHLGILLSGLPGCGKTASIKAIAKYTQRHIINVNFKYIETATQLKNLFFSKDLYIYTDVESNQKKKIYVPPQKRLYVLEEIDAITDIVKQRTDNDVPKQVLNDELTLGEILNIIDGTLEVYSRMFIITTNHPETLDKALLRPGRIDVNIKFEKCDKECINKMYNDFFNKDAPKDVLNLDITPSELQQRLMMELN